MGGCRKSVWLAEQLFTYLALSLSLSLPILLCILWRWQGKALLLWVGIDRGPRQGGAHRRPLEALSQRPLPKSTTPPYPPLSLLCLWNSNSRFLSLRLDWERRRESDRRHNLIKKEPTETPKQRKYINISIAYEYIWSATFFLLFKPTIIPYLLFFNITWKCVGWNHWRCVSPAWFSSSHIHMHIKNTKTYNRECSGPVNCVSPLCLCVQIPLGCHTLEWGLYHL